MSSTTPDRDPAMEPVPDAGYGLDPEESTGDPLEPVPMDGRDGQPAEGSSDDEVTMAEDDPLRAPAYVEEEDPAYVDDEADLLEDDGTLEDPEADELANESLRGDGSSGLDQQLDEDLAEELGDDPDSASN